MERVAARQLCYLRQLALVRVASTGYRHPIDRFQWIASLRLHYLLGRGSFPLHVRGPGVTRCGSRHSTIRSVIAPFVVYLARTHRSTLRVTAFCDCLLIFMFIRFSTKQPNSPLSDSRRQCLTSEASSTPRDLIFVFS